MESFIIQGKRIAARNLAQALFAYRVALSPDAHAKQQRRAKLDADARLARMQPYPDNTGAVNPMHARGGSHNGL